MSEYTKVAGRTIRTAGGIREWERMALLQERRERARRTFLVSDDRIARCPRVKITASTPRAAAVEYARRLRLLPKVWIWVIIGRYDWSYEVYRSYRGVGRLRATGSGVML